MLVWVDADFFGKGSSDLHHANLIYIDRVLGGFNDGANPSTAPLWRIAFDHCAAVKVVEHLYSPRMAMISSDRGTTRLASAART